MSNSKILEALEQWAIAYIDQERTASTADVEDVKRRFERAEQAIEAEFKKSLPADSEELAKMFHENYEELASKFNYKTRKASAVPWENVPRDNKALMIAVAGEILDTITANWENKDE